MEAEQAIITALASLLSALVAYFTRPAVDRARERKRARASEVPEIPKPPQVPQ